MEDWQKYEILAERIFKELNGKAEVKHNDKILGYESCIPRQIDVSIRSIIEGIDILIIIQAKDYNRKVDVNVVGEFSAVVRDVKATKGILICNKGFTS